MRVVDTSAWLEWISDSALGRELGAKLPQTDEWIVPTIVQYELTRWLTREVSEEAAERTVAFSMRCLIAPLDTRIAIRAADYGRGHSLAFADAIIYATAMEHDADLLTCDAHFAKLPGVVYLQKTSP